MPWKAVPQESVHPSKTGRNIESLNCEILGIARDAAFLYWITGEEKYARLAAGVFDTYMTGIYYRNVPVDLNHGHQQTLVGLTSFEVIHEDALHIVVPLYDFLYHYLQSNYPDKMMIYAGALKKWADNIITNGVPHNNWDLLQARYIMNVGLVLEDNEEYADGKGREYYIDYVMNRSSIRQWSLTKLADYGFDSETGIWAECPGYSSVVINDYANFANQFDHNLQYDLVKAMPVLAKAVADYSAVSFSEPDDLWFRRYASKLLKYELLYPDDTECAGKRKERAGTLLHRFAEMSESGGRQRKR